MVWYGTPLFGPLILFGKRFVFQLRYGLYPAARGVTRRGGRCCDRGSRRSSPVRMPRCTQMTVQANINWRWIRSDANFGRFGHPGCNTSTFPSKAIMVLSGTRSTLGSSPTPVIPRAWHCTCYLPFQIDVA